MHICCLRDTDRSRVNECPEIRKRLLAASVFCKAGAAGNVKEGQYESEEEGGSDPMQRYLPA